MKIVDFFTSGEDLYCSVICDCSFDNDEPLYVSMRPDYVSRCPKCGKGYRPEMRVFQYEKNETDANYAEWTSLLKTMEKYKEFHGHPEKFLEAKRGEK